MWPFNNSKCKCDNCVELEVNGKKFKKCTKCQQEYQYNLVYVWLKCEPGAIEKEQKKSVQAPKNGQQ